MLKVLQSRSKKFKKSILIGVPVVAIIVFSALAVLRNLSNAVKATDFNPGRIIDDSIFYNKDAMNVQQIQSFLNKQIGSCDTWGTGPSGKNDGRTAAQFAAAQNSNYWHKPPYVCINNYHENPNTGETSFEKGGGSFEGGISAAQIIYDAAQKYGINPQVLLVLLKKESLNLLDDNWPVKTQYKYAMGYACPDSGPGFSAACADSKAGFYKQMTLAAWQLKYYKDHHKDGGYSLKLGWNNIQYSPNPACGTKRVNIENVATLSLYIYTPYVPNDSALANYPGTSHCGAYGNRNFFMFFNQLFGSTLESKRIHSGIYERYIELGGEKGYLGDVDSEFFKTDKSIFQRFKNGFIIGSDSTGYWENYGKIRQRYSELGYEHGKMGLPLSGYFNTINNGRAQKYQNGFIIGSESTGYWESIGLIREKYAQLGYEHGKMGLPITQEFSTIQGGWFQKYQNGFIIGSPKSGYHESYGKIRERWNKIGNEKGALGFPIGDVIEEKGYKIQHYERGDIIGNDNLGYREIQGDVFKFYNSLNDTQKDKLGLPLKNEAWNNGKWTQNFERGLITGVGNKYILKIDK